MNDTSNISGEDGWWSSLGYQYLEVIWDLPNGSVERLSDLECRDLVSYTLYMRSEPLDRQRELLHSVGQLPAQERVQALLSRTRIR